MWSPKGAKREQKGHQECIQKSMSEKGCKLDLCQRAFFLIKQEGNCLFSYFSRLSSKKLILCKYVFYTVNIRFFEVPGGLAGLSLSSILGPFSIKNLIKNQCKNRCRTSDEILCQNVKNDANMGPKIMIF